MNYKDILEILVKYFAGEGGDITNLMDCAEEIAELKK